MLIDTEKEDLIIVVKGRATRIYKYGTEEKRVKNIIFEVSTGSLPNLTLEQSILNSNETLEIKNNE